MISKEIMDNLIKTGFEMLDYTAIKKESANWEMSHSFLSEMSWKFREMRFSKNGQDAAYAFGENDRCKTLMGFEIVESKILPFGWAAFVVNGKAIRWFSFEE